MIQVSVHKNTGRVTAFGAKPSGDEVIVMVPRSVDVAFGWVYDARNNSFYQASADIIELKPSIWARAHKMLFGSQSPYQKMTGT